jgi:hypothetical protein
MHRIDFSIKNCKKLRIKRNILTWRKRQKTCPYRYSVQDIREKTKQPSSYSDSYFHRYKTRMRQFVLYFKPYESSSMCSYSRWQGATWTRTSSGWFPCWSSYGTSRHWCCCSWIGLEIRIFRKFPKFTIRPKNIFRAGFAGFEVLNRG